VVRIIGMHFTRAVLGALLPHWTTNWPVIVSDGALD
jgi:hypothetical protein